MELNKIQSIGSWGKAADDLNQNFCKVNNAVEQVKNATTRNKGYFSSDTELKSAFPSANVGDIAYVGSAYPYQTWAWDGSAWKKKNDAGGEESVNLGDYYTKEETNGKLAETDAKLSELGSESFLPREVLSSMNINNVTTSGLFLLDSTRTYENSPLASGLAGFLRVTKTISGFILQEVFQFSGNDVFKRRGNSSGSFESWQKIEPKNGHTSSPNDLKSCNLDDVRGNVTYLLVDTETYENAPYSNAIGFLRVSTTYECTLQEFYPFSGDFLYKRRITNTGTAESWQGVSDENTHKSAVKYLSSCNLNDVRDNKTYLLDGSTTYENSPLDAGWAGFLRVTTTYGFTLQEIYQYSGKKLYKRRLFGESAIEEWQLIGYPDNILYAPKNYLASCNLNDLRENASYLLVDTETYGNAPYSNAIGFLRTTVMNTFILQEFYSFSGFKLYKRRGNTLNTWTEWGEISGAATEINQYPIYNNSYEVSCTPTITTDTNNYLTSTNDNNDRSADIISMLNTTGIGKLGAGTYYIKDIEMPDDTTIEGCGTATKVILVNSASYGFKMGKKCFLKGFHLMGATSDISVSSDIAERHGIIWQGDYSSNQNNNMQPQRGQIDNLWISRFTGGGITCYNTGYGTICNLAVSNVNIWNCNAGVNISYWSEFHRFTNVKCSECYYGCINNGGNNMFVNCDFSSNLGIAFLMDNTNEKSPNNSHGSVVGCVFNHTAANKGIGIKIINCANGYSFTGCQIFYSQIVIENSSGITISNTNFGLSNCDITINGGYAILFANNMFGGNPTKTITNNTTTKFVNCYNRSNGEEIS